MSRSLDTFNQIWLVDAEFSQPEGKSQAPIGKEMMRQLAMRVGHSQPKKKSRF
jgi:hypothetical protein